MEASDSHLQQLNYARSRLPDRRWTHIVRRQIHFSRNWQCHLSRVDGSLVQA